MKQWWIGILFCMFGIVAVQAQNREPIEVIKKSGGIQFYQNEVRLKMPQIKTILKSNELAYNKFKTAQGARAISNILSFSGGLLVGWPIGTAISGDKPNWIPAVIGTGIWAFAIPIAISANKQLGLAIDQYNQGIPNTFSQRKPEVHLAVQGDGVGITINF